MKSIKRCTFRYSEKSIKIRQKSVHKGSNAIGGYVPKCSDLYGHFSFGDILGQGLFIFCGGIAITLPVWVFIGMGLLPALVDKLIMGDKISPKDKKQRTLSRTAAITSGVIIGSIMGNKNKKVNEKYKVKE